MTTTKDGGAAFPVPPICHVGAPFMPGTNGMSLRAWLVGQAMAGRCGYRSDQNITSKSLVDAALDIADRAIAELEGGAQ